MNKIYREIYYKIDGKIVSTANRLNRSISIRKVKKLIPMDEYVFIYTRGKNLLNKTKKRMTFFYHQGEK